MAHDVAGGLTGWDLEGFHNGGDTECWRRLGSHEVTIFDDERGEIHGTRFAVWAPNAHDVRLNADFNWWTGDQMHRVPGSGIWALFVEGVGTGALYKYNILCADGTWREKVDPMAFFAEQAPANSSIVYTSKYLWADDEWMSRRSAAQPHKEPMSIYDELGVRPLINASATLTRLGGSLMPPEVLEAMLDASRHFINLDELQLRTPG